jgi:hypothetical protein
MATQTITTPQQRVAAYREWSGTAYPYEDKPAQAADGLHVCTENALSSLEAGGDTQEALVWAYLGQLLSFRFRGVVK